AREGPLPGPARALRRGALCAGPRAGMPGAAVLLPAGGRRLYPVRGSLRRAHPSAPQGPRRGGRGLGRTLRGAAGRLRRPFSVTVVQLLRFLERRAGPAAVRVRQGDPKLMRKPVPERQHAVTVGGHRLTIEDVCAVSRGAPLSLSTDKSYIGRIERGAQVLTDAIAAGRDVYGVNTGYGDSCTVTIPPEVVNQLPAHLVRYHGCGMGAYF